LRKHPAFPLLCAAVLAAGLTLVRPPDPAGAAAPAASCSRGVAVPSEETALLRGVRRLRAQAGLPSLRGDKGLQRLARAHSVVATRGSYLAHTLPLPFQGVQKTGQNMARAGDAGTALALMLSSPPHRQVMFDPGFSRAGVGAAVDCRGVVTYTLNVTAARRR
jgi:uncharacterized protein YkwD